MGVKSLWQSLIGADLVEQWNGQNPAAVPSIAAELEGKVLAVDLSMWIMQAGEQIALAPYCKQDEAAAKVAFERAVHWLRFGVTPVFVIEGLAPAEKRSAQQSRLYDGGRGTSNARINAYNNVAAASMNPTQFIRSSQQVAAVLEAMGFPVIQAPGEAEATCAALCTAGLVDGVASFDGDTLLFGAEIVYPVVKLSTTQEKSCALTKCTLGAVRRHLGLTAPGSGRHALGLFAVLCGCDYDESGAQGVGGVGAMALVKNLLKGQTDDSNILDKFEILLHSDPDPSLVGLVKCTGCLQCKHEGGKTGKIKFHNAANNPCPCCRPAPRNNNYSTGCGANNGLNQHNQGCIPQSGECQCNFHRRTNDRIAERVAAKARAEPDLAQRARDAVAVYLREAEQASAAVEHEMLLRNITPGQKLTWLHRPNVKSVQKAITALQGGGATRIIGGALDWDISTLRSKMIPALIEWDLRHPPKTSSEPLSSQQQRRNRQVEFLLKIIKKVQGSGAPGTQWRYLVEFERAEGVDVENFGSNSLKPLNTKSVAGAVDVLIDESDNSGGDSGGGSHDSCATQRPIENAQGIDVGVFDGKWLASDLGKTHRGVRMSLIRQNYSKLEAAFLEKGSRVAATPARRRNDGGGGGGGSKNNNNNGVGTSRKQRQQHQQQQQPITTPAKPHSPTNSLAHTPIQRHQQHRSDHCNMSPGSIDRYLVQQRRDTSRIHGEIEDTEKDNTIEYQGGRGVLGQGGQGAAAAAARCTTREGKNKEEVEEDSPSPSKKQRNITKTPLHSNRNYNTRSPVFGSGSTFPRGRQESVGMKTLKTIVEKRNARLAAEAARLEAMTEEERADWLERTRKRGAEVGRLLSSGSGGGGDQTAPAPPTARQGAEVIDLVSPLSSSSSEEEEQEEEQERTIRQKRRSLPPPPAAGAAQPPAPRRRSWRHQQQQQQHQGEIVIDLTGDSD